MRMIEEIGVAATPGVDFDPINGHKFLRLYYGGAHEQICEGLKRITRWPS